MRSLWESSAKTLGRAVNDRVCCIPPQESRRPASTPSNIRLVPRASEATTSLARHGHHLRLAQECARDQESPEADRAGLPGSRASGAVEPEASALGERRIARERIGDGSDRSRLLATWAENGRFLVEAHAGSVESEGDRMGRDLGAKSEQARRLEMHRSCRTDSVRYRTAFCPLRRRKAT
jgi:hypothetical protein